MTQAYYNKKAINASLIKEVLKSPQHGYAMLNSKQEPTDSMALGSLVHHLVLTPSLPLDSFVFAEEGQRFKAAEKEQYAREGKTIVRSYMKAEAESMTRAIQENTFASDLLNGSITEEEIYFTTPDGTPCKSKLDARKGGVLIDLKTGSHADVKDFARTVVNYDYHTQLAFYRGAMLSAGVEFKQAYIIHVTNAAPYICRVFKLSDDFLMVGDTRVSDAMETAINLMEGWKPEQPSKVIDLDLPGWVK